MPSAIFQPYNEVGGLSHDGTNNGLLTNAWNESIYLEIEDDF